MPRIRHVSVVGCVAHAGNLGGIDRLSRAAESVRPVAPVELGAYGGTAYKAPDPSWSPTQVGLYKARRDANVIGISPACDARCPGGNYHSGLHGPRVGLPIVG